jgi:hypothetical protein
MQRLGIQREEQQVQENVDYNRSKRQFLLGSEGVDGNHWAQWVW